MLYRVDRVNNKIKEVVRENSLKEIIITLKLSTCIQLDKQFVADSQILYGNSTHRVGYFILDGDTIIVNRSTDYDITYEKIYDMNMNSVYTCKFDLDFPKTFE